MATLEIEINIDSLSELTPITAPNTYQFFVMFFDSNGNPLANPNVPATYTASVTTNSPSFVISVPVSDGPYTIPNVTVRIFANNQDNCCFAESTFTIVAGEPGETTFMPVISYQGLAEHADIQVEGVGGSSDANWLVSDNSQYPLDAGKQWWYWVNRYQIKLNSTLQEYPYQSNRPFIVLKIGVITGTDSLYRWANPGEQAYIEGYSNPNQGQTLNHGASGAVVRIGFNKITP